MMKGRMDYVPVVLVNSITKRAPMCNGILNSASGSSPPPPQVGFAKAVALVPVLVAFSKTCLATTNELFTIGSSSECIMFSIRISIFRRS